MAPHLQTLNHAARLREESSCATWRDVEATGEAKKT
jgi:hypothetical protein